MIVSESIAQELAERMATLLMFALGVVSMREEEFVAVAVWARKLLEERHKDDFRVLRGVEHKAVPGVKA
jgi:hypothetical protein